MQKSDVQGIKITTVDEIKLNDKKNTRTSTTIFDTTKIIFLCVKKVNNRLFDNSKVTSKTKRNLNHQMVYLNR